MPRTIASSSSARGIALSLAAAGRQVAVVSGGDPGVFAMAAAVFEAVETGDPAWRGLDIRVEPGVTAMLAAAAEVGAPLGGDFCAISLSDNLKAWTHDRAPAEGRGRGRLRDRALQSRLEGAAASARPGVRAVAHGQGRRDAGAVRARRRHRRGEGRHDDARRADPARADMRTLVIVGASTTRQVGRWVYTPRSERGARRERSHATACFGARHDVAGAAWRGRAIMTTGRPSARAASILA